MSTDSASAEGRCTPAHDGRVRPQLGEVRNIPKRKRQAGRTNAAAELDLVVEVQKRDVVLQVREREACKERVINSGQVTV